MLKNITIDNLLIIKKAEISFANGFNIIIGETGSGKSIILDAILIALGSKSSKDLIRYNEEKAIIIVEFDTQNNHEVKNILKEHEIEAEDLLFIKKVIAKDYSKIFINDHLATITLINKLKPHLLEINSQFERYDMSYKDYLTYLDKFLDLEQFHANLKEKFSKMNFLKKEYENKIEIINNAQKDLEYLLETKKDLENLNPIENEYETLIEQRNELLNLEKISNILNKIKNELNEINLKNISINFNKNISKLSSLISEEKFAKLETIELALDKLSFDFQEQQEAFDLIHNSFLSKENLLLEVESRIVQYKDVGYKYKHPVNDLTNLLKNITEKLLNTENAQVNLDEAKKQYLAAEQEYLIAAKEISQLRKNGVNMFIETIKREMHELNLENARLEACFEDCQPTQCGIDKFSIIAAMNSGMKLMAIDKIASGGELSRFILALKIALSKKAFNASFFFDEIDTGVSGRVANTIGKKLKLLGKSNQVISISHNPQVIAKADRFFLVTKLHDKQLDITTATVREIEGDERVNFVASIISGENVTDQSIENAKLLFE